MAPAGYIAANLEDDLDPEAAEVAAVAATLAAGEVPASAGLLAAPPPAEASAEAASLAAAVATPVPPTPAYPSLPDAPASGGPAGARWPAGRAGSLAHFGSFFGPRRGTFGCVPGASG